MRKLVTALAVVAALVWSALIWGGYAILALTTDLLVSGSGGLGLAPELDQIAIWIGSLVDRFGTGTAAVIWVIGLVVIWMLRGLINGLLGKAQPTQLNHPAQTPPPAGPTSVTYERPDQHRR